MLLALDRSTTPASASIFSCEGAHIATVLDADATCDAYLLAMKAVSAANASIADIHRFAVAVGPGSFSGIRSALALLNGLAIPINAEVIGIPSAATIWKTFKAAHPEYTAGTIIGDARRGKLWVWNSADPPAAAPNLIEPASWQSADPATSLDAPIITPDLRRLSPFLSQHYPAEMIFKSDPISRAIGELALEGVRLPPTPIYLSAAV